MTNEDMEYGSEWTTKYKASKTEVVRYYSDINGGDIDKE